MAVYTKVKAMGVGPYIRSSTQSLVQATLVDTGLGTSEPQMEIFPEYIKFTTATETSRYVASRLLSLDSELRTKTVDASSFLTSTDDSITITNNVGKANLEIGDVPDIYEKVLPSGTYAYWTSSDHSKFPVHAHLRTSTIPMIETSSGSGNWLIQDDATCHGSSEIVYRKNTAKERRYAMYIPYLNTGTDNPCKAILQQHVTGGATVETGLSFNVIYNDPGLNGRIYLVNNTGNDYMVRFEIINLLTGDYDQ